MSIEVVGAKCTLKLIIRCNRHRLAIYLESLDPSQRLSSERRWMTYSFEIIKVFILIGSLDCCPGILRPHVRHVSHVKDMVLFAIDRGMTLRVISREDTSSHVRGKVLLPSCLQLLHFAGGLSGQSRAT